MSLATLEKQSACTSILIGRLASADGSVIIGRNEDSKAAWPKHFVAHPAKTVTATPYFQSKDTGVRLPLPLTSLAYTATPEWTDQFGVFEEAGINSANVAMSATESAYANARVLAYDPLVPTGIAEEALVTVVLPYIESARAGVQRLGQLIEQYGTSESNGILFADQQEAWYLETVTGHLWVAQRIPDNGYAVVANQLAIQEVAFDQPEQFLMAAGLATFAAKHHLWQPDTPFNVRAIFGTKRADDLVYNTPRVWDGQRQLTPSVTQTPESFDLPFIQYPDQPIQLDQAMTILGSHYQGTTFDPAGPTPVTKHYRPISLAKTQEAHLLQLRNTVPAALSGIHWLALGVAAESLFVPFYAGISQTPANYHLGQATYDDQSAYWTYKLLGVLVDSHYARFQPLLADMQRQFYSQSLGQLAQTDQQAQHLTGTALTQYLNQASAAQATAAEKAVKQLTAALITTATDLSPLNFKTDTHL